MDMVKLKKGSPSRPWIPPRVAQDRRINTEFDYNCSRWRKDRRLHLSQYPLCKQCLDQGIHRASRVSDHTKPVRDGGDPWSWDNRQALCYPCHNKKSGREAHTRPGRGG